MGSQWVKCPLHMHKDFPLDLQSAHKAQAQLCMPVISVLGRQRQTDPLSSLARQSSQSNELQSQ